MAQGNDEIHQFLVINILQVLEFHNKYHAKSKNLNKVFLSLDSTSGKKIKKCLTCYLYNQTPLAAGCNPKVFQEMKFVIWMCFILQSVEK